MLNNKLKMIYVSDFSKDIFFNHIGSNHKNMVIENPIIPSTLPKKIKIKNNDNAASCRP